jgi:hypothetical protein
MRAALVVLPALVLGLQQPTPPPAKDKVKDSPYFPLKVGAAWEYRTGTATLTVRLVKFEPVGGVLCARLEAGEGAARKVEHVAVQADGVYRFQYQGKKIDPPLCLLKLPPKAGQTWKVKYTTDGLAVEGTFTQNREEVAVPAGKYKAVTVTSTDLEVAGSKVRSTCSYAEKVGPVKQAFHLNGRDLVLELVRYVPPK